MIRFYWIIYLLTFTLAGQACAQIFETRRSIEGRFKPAAAIGNGVADCAAALSATTLQTILPAGDYRISTNCTIGPQVQFVTGAKLIIDAGVTVTFSKSILADPLQHIFQCGVGARVLLKQAHSIRWYGALDWAAGTGNNSPLLAAAIRGATNPDAAGYAQQSGEIYIPPGTYRFDDPITYYGSNGHGLVIKGDEQTGVFGGAGFSEFRWYGDAATFIYYRGANYCTFQDIGFTSYTGLELGALIWFDSISANAIHDVRDVGSGGCALQRCRLSVNGDMGVCAIDAALVAIGHVPAVGDATSQVSEIDFVNCSFSGPITAGVVQYKAYGIHVRGGGNVKVFRFHRSGMLYLQRGLSWDSASSYIVMTDASFGYNELDLHQVGGGKLTIIGGNSEHSNKLLYQSAGVGGCEAEFHGFEFSGEINTAGTRDIIRVAGGVALFNCTVTAGVGQDTDANSIPWITLGNNARYSLTNHYSANEETHTSFTAINTTFGLGYDDGASIQAPIRDGSGNAVYQLDGSFAGYDLPIWIEGCFSLQNAVAGAGVKIQQRRTGPQHLYVRTKADLATALTSQYGLVTTGGGATIGDGGGRTYYYDRASEVADDNDLVETGPAGVGRFHVRVPESWYVNGATRVVSTKPVLTVTGSTTGGVFASLNPDSIPENFTVLEIDVPPLAVGVGLNVQGNCSTLHNSQVWNYHPTGDVAAWVRSVAGDTTTRWFNSSHDWSGGIDHSDGGSWKLSASYIPGTNQALRVDKTTFAATHYGPVAFAGTTHAGLRLNSLTTAQRDAITAVDGDLILNTTDSKVQARVAGAWVDLH